MHLNYESANETLVKIEPNNHYSTLMLKTQSQLRSQQETSKLKELRNCIHTFNLQEVKQQTNYKKEKTI